MLEGILSKIICETYEREFRHKQEKDKYIAMKISFSIPIDYKKEEGYRYLELLVMWEGYVGVFLREGYNVVPIEGVDFGKDSLKKGYEYKEGVTDWKCLSCHDSCWRGDGIERFVFENRERLNSIRQLFNWYEKIELTEKENEFFRGIERERRK